MDASELDLALEELETRLERLRGLYDQYFLGIEKLEPAVARKDVDRRVWLLRREKIRNTAKRFKLQVLIQRYNAFQQYWQRICREIEAGTYKRHLVRAEKAFGPTEPLTIASRRRQRGRGADASDAPPSDAPSEARTEANAEAEQLLAAVAQSGATAAPANELPPPEASAGAFRASEPASAVARMAAGLPVATAPARRQPLGSLDLDLDFAGKAAERPPATEPQKAPPTEPDGDAESRAFAARPPAAGVQKASKPAPALNAAARSRPKEPVPSAALDDTKLRELHARLLAAKRQTNDPTPISLEKLSKSLQDAEKRLRERHANRKIDFDVVIKDGKAIVKPILR